MLSHYKSLLYILLIAASIGCTNRGNLTPVVDPSNILRGSDEMANYITDYINFDSDFSAFDSNGKVMPKENFLTEVLSGRYLPLRLNQDIGENSYVLHKIDVLLEDSPKYYLIDQARKGLFQLSKIGKPAPKFDFVDLLGNRYNSENMGGKILVMKFWFIGCVACVQEMPEVNKIVDKFKDRSDIVFVSLASDKAEDLRAFLKQRAFKYQTVANADYYMVDSIGVKVFPSHLIIGRDGKISKFTMQFQEVEKHLTKITKAEQL